MNKPLSLSNASSNFRFKTCVMCSILACMTVIIGCGKEKKETYQLKLNLDKNDTFIIQMKTNETVRNNEGDKIIKQASNMDAKFEVVNIDSDGVYSFRVIFDPIIMTAENQAGRFEFSSWQTSLPEHPDVRDLCAFYALLCKRAIIVKVTPRGRIIQVLGNERLYFELVDLLKPDLQTAEQLRILTSEDGIKNVIYYFFQILPERKVKKDQIWKDRQVFKMSFPTDILMTSTLSGINKDTATLMCRADVGIDTSSAVGPENYSGWQTRTVTIDTKTGMVKKSDIEFSYAETIKDKATVQKIKSTGTVTIEVK